jgi:hypothetical protein
VDIFGLTTVRGCPKIFSVDVDEFEDFDESLD